MTFEGRWGQSRKRMKPLLDWFHKEWHLHVALRESFDGHWIETSPEVDKTGIDLVSEKHRVGLRSREDGSIPRHNGVPRQDVTFRVRADGTLESLDGLDWYCYGVFDGLELARAVLFRVTDRTINAARYYLKHGGFVQNRSGRNGFVAVSVSKLVRANLVVSRKGWDV